MISIVDSEKYKRIFKFYKIFGNENIMLAKKYSKGWEINYYRDLIEPFENLIHGIVNIIVFPFKLIYILYSFLPRIIINSKKE